MSRVAAKILVFKKEIPMLVNCTQCGSRIAHTAKTCPRCGAEDSAKIPTYQEWCTQRWVSIVLVIIGIVVFIIPIFSIFRVFAMPGIFKAICIGGGAYLLLHILAAVPTRAKYDKALSK